MKRSGAHKILALFVALLLGAGCAQAEPSPNVLHIATATAIPSPQPTDEIVNGVNITELLAEPRPDEIKAILADWASRDVSVHDYIEEHSTILRWGETTFRLRVVSHTVGGLRHYGAIFVPDGVQEPGSLPVIVFLHPGINGVPAEAVQGLGDLLSVHNRGVRGQFVYVIPSFRGEPLIAEGKTYQSEGDPSYLDFDVDDAMALLSVALETTPEADPRRIGVLGVSRGASAGLLMAARDLRVDLVVEIAGLTTSHGQLVKPDVRAALLGDLEDPILLLYAKHLGIQELKEGRLGINEVRLRMIRRSPEYFAHLLPELQVQHGGSESNIVTIKQFIGVLQQLGRSKPEFEAYIYPGGTHNLETLHCSPQIAAAFLSRLLTFDTILAGGPALKHGDIISLQAQVENEGPLWLDGQTQSGTVGLAPICAAPYTGARWKVYDENGDGVISLESQGNVEGQRWLDGRTADGSVGLAPDRESYTGTNWQVVDLGNGVIALRNLGHLDGPRWLESQPQSGTIRLVSDDDYPFIGTSWLIVHP
jgi:acetyl esterase/lipase